MSGTEIAPAGAWHVAPGPHPARAVRGFTLIEVLVALAIVAVGVAAVLGALTSSANTVLYLRDKTFAQWVGLNQMATVRLSGQLQQPGNSDGDIDFAGRKWHWRQEVTTTEIPGVVRIDIKVRPADVKADEDNGWFTTVSGVQGDAVAAPNGYLPNWGSQTLPGIMPGSNSLGGNSTRTNPIGLGSTGGFGTLGSPGTQQPGMPVNPVPTPTPTPQSTPPQGPQ